MLFFQLLIIFLLVGVGLFGYYKQWFLLLAKKMNNADTTYSTMQTSKLIKNKEITQSSKLTKKINTMQNNIGDARTLLFQFLKVLCIALIIIFVIRYMSGEDAVEKIFKLNSDIFNSKFLNLISLIFNWLLYANIFIVTLGILYKNNFLIMCTKYVVLPITILCVIFIKTISLGIVGVGYFAFDFRAILIAIELGLLLFISLMIVINTQDVKINKKILYIIPLYLLAMPNYLISGLFGNANLVIAIKGVNLPHRMMIYLVLIVSVCIYFSLKTKSKENKKTILLYISLVSLVSFSINHKFDSFLDITNWPFHLCNTAMYIIPICIIFKLDILFYFTYFINVLGAFLAILMPNYSSSLNLFSDNIIGFYINHYIAFAMPILMVALGIYARPNLRSFIYSLIGFGIYFSLIVFINAWFSNYARVDYFFVNSDFVADKLGRWAENLRDITFELNILNLKLVFYPLYQTLFFIVYIVLSLLMWLIYVVFYKKVDEIQLLKITNHERLVKLENLDKLLNGKSRDCIIDMKYLDKLTISDFSKKYSTSDVWAVKNANLIVKSGEIFGFLGPNGAGKSTIIKSIVGIQTISEGKINICGYDIETQNISAKKLIGFVPDHYLLYENLTGREYVNYIADLYDVDKKVRSELINKYVEMFELEKAFDNQINTYSHGMKQKITIMSALIHQPKLWILDEPLTGLDPNSIYQVKQCMKDYAKAGNIVFFSSHIIDVVERICDRIAIIKSGKILLDEKVKTIEKNSTLEKFYLDTINKS